MIQRRFLPAFAVLLLVLAFSNINVAAKDEWLAVRSKNFYLIGNASDKDIRKVATRLEQFREVFRQILSKINFNSPVPTTVIVFKDDKAYNPFKPVRATGKINKNIAGYFMPGSDGNYITLAVQSDMSEVYGTIFHEYTHFLVNNNIGKSTVPPWFNEGLAEYYQTFKIEDDQKATLGSLQNGHLYSLQQNKLIPFDTFFNIDNYSLHQQGDHGTNMFYAQSWALMHYLIHGNGGARSKQMYKFLDLVMNGKAAREAFSEAFQTDYAAMEKELTKYVEKSSYNITGVVFKNKLTFDTEMRTAPLTEAQGQAYLGDLLYHMNRLGEAETLLQQSLTLNPDSSLAQTSLGLVKMRQKNFDEAKKYLEKAVASDSNNYLAHYSYAYVLSREAMNGGDFVSSMEQGSADKMRQSLKKAIALNPDFAGSYDLFAFISVVRNENLDEAVQYMKKALQMAPGNQQYMIRAAELLMRKKEFAEAKLIAQRVLETADDQNLKSYAQSVLSRISSYERRLEEIKKYNESGGGIIGTTTRTMIDDKPMSEEEIAKTRAEMELKSLNNILRKPKEDEKRVLGYLTKIDCSAKGMTYTVKVDGQLMKFTSASFDTVDMITINVNLEDGQVNCGALKKETFALVTYRAGKDAKTTGEVVAFEFVPEAFKLLN
ncbi:MAG TPA: tetratricopeptide repeat protein [Pyrinomonadaceae bacterium]